METKDEGGEGKEEREEMRGGRTVRQQASDMAVEEDARILLLPSFPPSGIRLP